MTQLISLSVTAILILNIFLAIALIFQTYLGRKFYYKHPEPVVEEADKADVVEENKKEKSK